MITMNIYQKIQDCKKKHLTKLETAKKFKISRTTVKKYWDMTEEQFAEYRKKSSYRRKHFDEFQDEIITVFNNINTDPTKEINISGIYEYLQEKHGQLTGSLRSFNNYIHYLLNSGMVETEKSNRLYMPVPEIPEGKQMQLDFGVYNDSVVGKVYIFAALLSSSRYKYVSVQQKPFKALEVIHHLLNCFDFYEGIPDQLVIDQDRTMVVSENRGDIIYTNQFQTFIEEMELDMHVCRKADPESKGKVENLVGFVKKSFLSVRTFESFSDVQKQLSAWLRNRANGKISQATKRIPTDAWISEKEHLRPCKQSVFRTTGQQHRQSRKVTTNSLINCNGIKYSVPYIYNNKEVWVWTNKKTVKIYEDEYTMQVIAEHDVPVDGRQKIINSSHYKDMSKKPATMYEEIKSRSLCENWAEFIDYMYKEYKRYFRDQFKHLNQFLNSEQINQAVLVEAVSLCLDLQQYSSSQFIEAYKYMESVLYEKKQNILPMMVKEIKKIQSSNAADSKVAKREIDYYKSIINILGVCL